MARVRTVSVEAFGQLALSERRAEAYELVKTCPYRTASELEEASGNGSVHKRLVELERLGLLSRLEPRVCRVTGRRAHIWRVATSPIDGWMRRSQPTRNTQTLREEVERLRSLLAEERQRTQRLTAEVARLSALGSLPEAPVWPEGAR